MSSRGYFDFFLGWGAADLQVGDSLLAGRGNGRRSRSGQVDDPFRLRGCIGVALGNGGAVKRFVVLDGADAGDAQRISEQTPAIGIGVAKPARAVTHAVRAGKVGGEVLQANDLVLRVAHPVDEYDGMAAGGRRVRRK